MQECLLSSFILFRDKQGMIKIDECSSWYNRVGDFCSLFGIGEKELCTVMDLILRLVGSTPLRIGSSMALSAMAVECEKFLILTMS